MRRHLVGICSLLFLASAAALYFGSDFASNELLLSTCERVGILLGAWWLAYRQLEGVLQRFPPWLLAALGGCVLVIFVRPRLAVLLVPVIAAIGVLQFLGWLAKPMHNRARDANPPTRPPSAGRKK